MSPLYPHTKKITQGRNLTQKSPILTQTYSLSIPKYNLTVSSYIVTLNRIKHTAPLCKHTLYIYHSTYSKYHNLKYQCRTAQNQTMLLPIHTDTSIVLIFL